ncbi:MAG: AbiV family abortive infection protein [Candidatus Saccharimonadales bacterium]
MKIDYYKLYAAAHHNAVDLLEEAELLYGKGKYARAYFMAFTGLEEIAKSQLAADVYSNLITEEEFNKHFSNHKRKIGRVLWATLDAQGYFIDSKEEIDRLEQEHPKAKDRMAAIYCDVLDDRVVSPRDIIGKNEAGEIIRVLEVAIQRIIEVEFMQGRIGTKGFMK